MPNTPDSPSSALGGLVSDALERSVETSLTSFASLRSAVGAYTLAQKERGRSLDSVIQAISTLLMEVEDERVNGSSTPLRDPVLARQLRAWCAEHFNSGD